MRQRVFGRNSHIKPISLKTARLKNSLVSVLQIIYEHKKPSPQGYIIYSCYTTNNE